MTASEITFDKKKADYLRSLIVEKMVIDGGAKATELKFSYPNFYPLRMLRTAWVHFYLDI